MHENRVNILHQNSKLFWTQNPQKSKEKHFRSNFLRVISKVSSNNVLSTQFRHRVLSSIFYRKLKKNLLKIVRKFRQNRISQVIYLCLTFNILCLSANLSYSSNCSSQNLSKAGISTVAVSQIIA